MPSKTELLTEISKELCKDCDERNYETCQKCKLHKIINERLQKLTTIKAETKEKKDNWEM